MENIYWCVTEITNEPVVIIEKNNETSIVKGIYSNGMYVCHNKDIFPTQSISITKYKTNKTKNYISEITKIKTCKELMFYMLDTIIDLDEVEFDVKQTLEEKVKGFLKEDNC